MELLGPYRLEAELGSGGMGRVYRARLERKAFGLPVGTAVAVKVVHPNLLETPDFFQRFLREAEVGRRISHVNVLRTYGADAVPDGDRTVHVLVMEYVEGQTLRSLLVELGRVPEELCRHVGREVALGLGAIHAAGAVHRDVKPENVLITKDHVVKVMDLGIARLSEAAARLSQTGMFVGSIHYASPEQFSGAADDIDGRADLFALGIVLYELSTGTHPFGGYDLRTAFARLMHETPRRCAEINPQLSPFFEEVVHTLLEKDREKRFRSAGDLAAVLERGEVSEWWHWRASALREATHRPLRRVRVPRETALYGREAEIQELRRRWKDVKAGAGQVVLIEGEAGIGKSRLADEFVGLLERDGEDLNYLFGAYPPGGAATASGAFQTAYREFFGTEGLEKALARHLAETPLLVPGMAALLRGDGAPPGEQPLTREAIQTCLVHVTRSLARERPTVVVVDDLSYAPKEGRALFAALAFATPGHRILLVGTARRGLDAAWVANLERGGALRLPLARLGARDVGRLLVDALRSERLAEEIGFQVVTKSDGNPFFVFEILRGLREGRHITQRPDGSWASTGTLREIEVPSSLVEMVNARIAALGEEERNLLEVASCAGVEFDPLLVGTALGLGRIPVLQTLGRIEKKHRLVRSVGVRYVFDHHEVQQILYQGVNELLRREYHTALAEALEARGGARAAEPRTLDGALAADLVGHFQRGGQPVRALRYLDAALDHLEKSYRHDVGARLAGEALSVPDLVTGTDRARLLLRRAAPLNALGRWDEEREALEEAVRLAEESGDARLHGSALAALGWHATRAGRFQQACDLLEEAVRRAGEAGDDATVASACGSLGLALWRLGRYGEARGHLSRLLDLAVRVGNREAEAAATGRLGMVLGAEGRYHDAARHLEREIVLAREIGDRSGEAFATGVLGVALAEQGRPEEARALQERHLALARELGDRRLQGHATSWLADLAADDGNLETARELAETALVLRRSLGAPSVIAESLVQLGRIESARGQDGPADAAFEEAVRIAKEANLATPLVLAEAHRARRDEGRVAEAERLLAEHDPRLEMRHRLEARWLLWEATHDRRHLARAKRDLDEVVAAAPPEDRALMVEGVRVRREIARALAEPSAARG